MSEMTAMSHENDGGPCWCGPKCGPTFAAPAPELTAAEKAEVARFGIHDETPGLPEVQIERGDR